MSIVNLWQDHTRIWIELYNEFLKRYLTLTENWLQLGIAPSPTLNNAFGVASMVQGVEIVGANITGDKQVTLNLRYSGEESAPAITIRAGAVRLNFVVDNSAIFISMMAGINPLSNFVKDSKSSKTPFNLTPLLSGSKQLNANWKSPTTVTVDLLGDATTLDEANLIGISVHKQ